MMSDAFSASYRPPGVYTVEEPASLPGTVGISPTVVGIVGPSVGFRSHTEGLTLVGTTAIQLAQLGIDSTSIVVTKADATFASVGDYTLTPGTGADTTASTPDDTLSIARSGGSTIADGEDIIISYQFTDPEYYEPLAVINFDDVKDAFGEPLDSVTGEIVSPISLAAKIAFDNGARRMVLLATPGSATSVAAGDLAAAYLKILTVEDVTIVVPLPVGIGGTDGAPGDTGTIGTDLQAHVESAAATGLFRVGVLGYESTTTIDPVLLAAQFRSGRVILAWPNALLFANPPLNTTVVVGGYYLAAAYAGRLAGLPVNMPLTKKTLRGFSGFPALTAQTMTRTTKDGWSKNGVAVTEQTATRGLVCRHGVSTDTANVLTREISIVRAKDAMINACIDSIEGAELIGTPIVAETTAGIMGVIQGVLESMVNSDVIVSYIGLTVRQTSIDPSVVEVRFQYRPAYPLNYVNIIFGIDTTTGAVVDTTTSATITGA